MLLTTQEKDTLFPSTHNHEIHTQYFALADAMHLNPSAKKACLLPAYSQACGLGFRAQDPGGTKEEATIITPQQVKKTPLTQKNPMLGSPILK